MIVEQHRFARSSRLLTSKRTLSPQDHSRYSTAATNGDNDNNNSNNDHNNGLSSSGYYDGYNDGYRVGDPVGILPPYDSDSEAVSLAFLISLSVTFAILMIILIIVSIYITFCGGDESDYDEEMGNDGVNGEVRPRRYPRNSNRPFRMLFNKKHSGMLLDSSFTNPGGPDSQAKLQQREADEFKKMSRFEIELYQRAKEFQKMSPPSVKEFGSFVTSSDLTFIKDRGIQSYFFLPNVNDIVDIEGNFLPSYLIQDKLDVIFTKYNKSSSTIMNYPLPYNKKEAVYFEVKIFRYPQNSNTIFSIGLCTNPYPYFRPPGMSNFSIAYESTGKLRINNPFLASTLLPKLQESDVVGVGYKYKTGTIFITHNGKKLMDVTQDVDVDLFPSIGAFNASYTRSYTRDGLLEDPDNVSLREALSEGREIELPEKIQRVHDPYNEDDCIDSDEVEFHVNLGQIGFVFIEANVKKYSFGSVYGEIGIPPSYNGREIRMDTILQKGEDLPPAYTENEDEDSFFAGCTSVSPRQDQPNFRCNSSSSDNNRSYFKATGTGISDSTQLGHRLRTVESYERSSSAYDREHNLYDNEVHASEIAGLDDLLEGIAAATAATTNTTTTSLPVSLKTTNSNSGPTLKENQFQQTRLRSKNKKTSGNNKNKKRGNNRRRGRSKR